MAKFFAGVVALVIGFSAAGYAAEMPRGPIPVVGPAQAAVPTRSAAEALALGKTYESGLGAPKDYERARLLYCEAARRADSDPEAFLALAWIYLNGRGVTRDDAIAVYWLQKAAARGNPQASNLLRLMPSTVAATVSSCPQPSEPANLRVPVPARIREVIARTAYSIGVDPKLVTAVIAVESAFNPRAVSRKNAQGLMQLIPETASRFGVRDAFDEEENVRGGTTYLRDLLKLFKGNLTLALAAYNAGEGAVLLNGGVPPYPETKDYIERVTRLCACEDALWTVAAR